MKIVWIGGNHLRHKFYLNAVNAVHPVSGIIQEKREGGVNDLLPEPPSNISLHDKNNFKMHFQNRKNAEEKYFKGVSLPECKILNVTKDTLNSNNTKKFIQDINPDLVLIYGSHLIKEPLFSILPEYTINLHAGLSPKYRGSATLFWPFMFLEPNFAGVTFHKILDKADAGAIIHQCVPELEMSDKIHDVACKAIIKASYDMQKIINKFINNKKLDFYEQKFSGKLFLESDFKAEHLRVNYDLYKDRMVKEYLNGNLTSKDPKLIKQTI